MVGGGWEIWLQSKEIEDGFLFEANVVSDRIVLLSLVRKEHS